MAFDINLLLNAAKVIANFIPQPKPPRTDFSALRASLPDYGSLSYFSPSPTPPGQVAIIDAKPIQIEISKPKEVATSCMACSRSHLTTIAGALDEALRFARTDGVQSPEVMKRIDMAEREVNIMERIDLSPDAIQNSPQAEQDFVRPFMPRIRELRQNIGQITSVDQLEKTAADANTVSRDFKVAQMTISEPAAQEKEPAPENDRVKIMENRLRRLQESGVNLNPVVELARKVQKGEISLEDARQKVRELLPEEA